MYVCACTRFHGSPHASMYVYTHADTIQPYYTYPCICVPLYVFMNAIMCNCFTLVHFTRMEIGKTRLVLGW